MNGKVTSKPEFGQPEGGWQAAGYITKDTSRSQVCIDASAVRRTHFCVCKDTADVFFAPFLVCKDTADVFFAPFLVCKATVYVFFIPMLVFLTTCNVFLAPFVFFKHLSSFTTPSQGGAMPIEGEGTGICIIA